MPNNFHVILGLPTPPKQTRLRRLNDPGIGITDSRFRGNDVKGNLIHSPMANGLNYLIVILNRKSAVGGRSGFRIPLPHRGAHAS